MAPPPAQPPSGRHVAVAVSGAVVSVSFYEYNYEYMNTVFGPDTRYWYQTTVRRRAAAVKSEPGRWRIR
ncbi:Hypothetical protein SMAX5B_000689 [Scophthalmus maximus]|uniref:Uncharacterized protein n=1 Tax=Scophthalmus maximus TaxID=52904 RepID=A0A2U9B6B1_SCOMX|nr:Hypothetical protein SMAX5B_000689 [Scophthalmus maximus]